MLPGVHIPDVSAIGCMLALLCCSSVFAGRCGPLGAGSPGVGPTMFIGGIGLDQTKPCVPKPLSTASSPSKWDFAMPPRDDGDEYLSILGCRDMLMITAWRGGRDQRRFFLPALALETGIRSAWSRALMWSKSLVRDVKVSWQTAHLCWGFQTSGESRRVCTHWSILDKTYGT